MRHLRDQGLLEQKGKGAATMRWKPLSAGEIAAILCRKQPQVTRIYLTSMLRDDELKHTIPDNPTHQDQKYRAT